MIKRIALAVMLATTVAVATAPAEAGPLRDTLRQAAGKVLVRGLSVTDCVYQKITGKPAFFCHGLR